jgi:hypothetical protein
LSSRLAPAVLGEGRRKEPFSNRLYHRAKPSPSR